MNKILLTLVVIIVIIVLGLVGYAFWVKSLPTTQPTSNNNQPPQQTQTAVEYTNNQYGFSISLPQDWQGYSVVTGKWQGDTINANGQVKTNAIEGPMVSLRNPLWTTAKPYQDIPVMVFTIQQWNDMQQDKFHIGAAPINPSELGRNSTYVFGLPARYNYAYPEGWQEVDTIIQNKSLKTFEPQQNQQGSAEGQHCGGNIANPPQCPAGYHCAPDPNSHLPFGDVGGICVHD